MLRWFIVLPFIIVAVIILLTIYLMPNSFIGCGSKPVADSGKCESADAVVVISGGDTTARTDAGIHLVKNGWASTHIVSGAAQDTTGPSNAAAMKKHALSAGIAEENIIVDEAALNTQQNAENTDEIMKRHGFTNIILVTSGYHQRRASLEFQRSAENVTVRNYPVINDNDWSLLWWLTPRGWWLAGSVFVKSIIFYVGAAS